MSSEPFTAIGSGSAGVNGIIRNECGQKMDARTGPPIRIASIGVANPPCCLEQKEAAALMMTAYGDRVRSSRLEFLNKILSHPSIRRRHVAVENVDQIMQLKDEDPDRRIDRYTHWAKTLSASAVKDALARQRIPVDRVSALIVNTCTGYVCPGISTYLIEELGLSRHIRAYDLVGSGCAGAISNLQLAEQFLKNHPGEIALCVSVEICSATFQMGNDLGLLISNAIFGDGASAAVLWDRAEGIELVASMSFYEPKFRDQIRYVHRNGQLHNQLSAQLPKIIAGVVPNLVAEMLRARGLCTNDVAHWAIHSGGEKIIQSLKDELALTESQIGVTRQIYAEYGNMSSPTVVFELQRILESEPDPGEWILAIAFGAGLTVQAFLFRV